MPDDNVKLSSMDALSLPDLVRAVRQRAGAEPLDRVEAALRIGEELASGADDLIGHFVTEARDAGYSWTQIGARIGVSKQAARQRFTTPPAPARLAGLEQQPRLAACLAAAAREAAADGAAEIGTHHQLLGLYQEGGAAVEGAAALARRAGLDQVGPAQLLGALALDPGSRARRVLGHLGASIPAIKKELECYISPGKQRRRRGRGKTGGQRCSFCGKTAASGVSMVAGPGVWICAECVDLAGEILAERASAPGGPRPPE